MNVNKEFFQAIADIEKEKGIPRDYMFGKIKQALIAAYKKDTPDCGDNIDVILDENWPNEAFFQYCFSYIFHLRLQEDIHQSS